MDNGYHMKISVILRKIEIDFFYEYAACYELLRVCKSKR